MTEQSKQAYITDDLQMNMHLQSVADRLDRIEGLRENPKFYKKTFKFSDALSSGQLFTAQNEDDATFESYVITQIAGPVAIGDYGSGNYVLISADGDMSFVGGATVFDDLYFPMTSGKLGGGNTPAWSAFQGNTYEYRFDIADYIHLPSQELIHSYKEGSDFEFHVHIVLNGSDVGATAVNYEIEYTIGDMGGGMSAATVVTSGDQTIPGGTADRTHLYMNITDITGTGFKIGAALKMRFRRIALTGAGADPTLNPFVLMVGVHIEKDSVGSRTETAK